MNGLDVRVGVILFAEDMGKMVSFYKNIMGFDTDWDGGPWAEFKTKSGPLSFAMYDRKSFVQAVGEPYCPPRGINLTMEIGIWLPKYSDVDREYERLTALGIKSFSGEPVTYPFGIRNFYVVDPEGNLLEIGNWGQE
ncbi:VOC family protein [Clostridium thermosuccinogenes]|uniref:VOC family protein n=1 Tax=Clostridium thermosuccinogenes TaxID=84032 RepID=UPI000CCBFD06|nr:VOC family protein [Pseudoclostridium thermosuccinogenes]PNT90271.1 lactoylglutathione lyase [Pseudoclostridium thermosuccinogenes]